MPETAPPPKRRGIAQGEDYFAWKDGRVIYNVSHGYCIARASGRKPYLFLPWIFQSMGTLVSIDRRWAVRYANLALPGLLVTTDHGVMLIDGWHRWYRAMVEKAPMPAYLLTVDETRAIQTPAQLPLPKKRIVRARS